MTPSATHRRATAAALAVLLVLAGSAPALAQNAGQIASARRGASCPGCNLFQADLSGLSAPGRSYARARLRQSDLSLTIMTRANFSGADLRDVNAYGGVFSSANFSGANLTNASFVGAHLDGASFAGATLDGLNLSGASLIGVRGLTQRQLSRACGDVDTRLAPGLSIPSC